MGSPPCKLRFHPRMSAGLGGAPQLSFEKGNQFLDLTGARSAPNVASLQENVPDCSPSPRQSCLLAAVQCSVAGSFLLEPLVNATCSCHFPIYLYLLPHFLLDLRCRNVLQLCFIHRPSSSVVSECLSLASSIHSSCFLACGTKIAGHLCCS